MNIFRPSILGFLSMVAISAAETHRDLQPVAVQQEFLSVFQLGIEIVVTDTRGHADLLDLNDTLILTGFLFLFGLLKAEFAVVHDFAHGRLCLRRDQDKVHLPLFSDAERLLAGHDTELFAFLTDQANFRFADLFVEQMILGSDR